MRPDNDRITSAFNAAFDTMVEPRLESPEWDDITARIEADNVPMPPRASKPRWFGPALAFAVMAAVLFVGGIMWVLDPMADDVSGTGGCPGGSSAEPGPMEQVRPEPSYVSNQSAVFDVARSRIIYLDAAGETWAFDVCTNTWHDTGADTTLARPSGSLVYDIDSDKTISLGESVAVYDSNENVWKPASMPSSYGLPFLGDAVYNPVTGRVLAQHGQNPGILAEYDVDTDTWTTLGEVNETVARFLVGYQVETDQLVFQTYAADNERGDEPSGVLVDSRTLEATPILTSSPPNVSGGFGAFIYATGTETPYVHAEDSGICRLDPETQEWDFCFDLADGPGDQYGAFAAMVMDPIHNRLVLIHGLSGSWWENANTEIWAIDLDNGEWLQLLASNY